MALSATARVCWYSSPEYSYEPWIALPGRMSWNWLKHVLRQAWVRPSCGYSGPQLAAIADRASATGRMFSLSRFQRFTFEWVV